MNYVKQIKKIMKTLSQIKNLIIEDQQELKTDILLGFSKIIFLSAFAFWISKLIFWITL